MNQGEQNRLACQGRASFRASPLVLLALCLSMLLPRSSFASDVNLDTLYQNNWFVPSPAGGPYSNYFGAWPAEGLTNASTAFYHGHSLGNSTSVAPSDGSRTLVWSAFGQPVVGLMPDVALGDVIPPPPGVNSNIPPANFAPVKIGDNTVAYYECQDPVGGAFWVPSTRQVIAAQPNNIEIHWRTTTGGTNVAVVVVGAVPARRPARLFWTESPYDAPTVNLQDLFPVIHYNSEVTRPNYQSVTGTVNGVTNVTTNVVSGVWVDGQKQIRALNVKGMFVLEYYETGSYDEQIQPVGIEIVQVMEPEILIQSADVGARLMPQDSYWDQLDGEDSLDADVTAGINDTAYKFGHAGPKQGWVFAIRRTLDDPWSLEIYWRHQGVMGVLWPFECDWYLCDWPKYPQIRVISDSAINSPPVLVPAELTAELMADMAPALHATLSASGKSLTMTQPGTCLMKYTTYDDIWFEVIKTVWRTDTTYFDLAPKDWTIGEELRSPGIEAHAMAFDGANDYVLTSESWVNQQSDWTVSLWFNPGAATSGVLYAEGGSGGVTFALEIGSDLSVDVGLWNRNTAGYWKRLYSSPNAVKPNVWQYLTATLSGGNDSNGTVRLTLDDQSWVSTNMPRVNFIGSERAVMGASMRSGGVVDRFFNGRLDEVRIWNTALSADAIQSNKYATLPGYHAGLIADYGFDEGEGTIVHNEVGDKDGTLYGDPFWCYGQIEPGADYASFPGYLYQPLGNRFNVNRYNYPTEANPDAASYLFGVNTNVLEVWWANRSVQDGMPAVFYPSLVSRYNCVWPTNAPEIVIASGRGSNGDQIENTRDALEFDGVSDSVVVTNSAAFQREDALTIEAWIALDSIGARQDIVSMAVAGDSPAGFTFGVDHDGSLYAIFANTWDGAQTLSWGRGELATGVWTHVAVTYQVDGEIAGYVNGKRVARQKTMPAPLKPAATNLVIGCATARDAHFDAHFLDGRIGEVRVWSVARAPGDIAGAFLGRLQGNEANLLAVYPFDRGEDPAILPDKGTNGLDGIVGGAAWVEPGRPIPVASQYLLADDSIYYQNNPAKPGYNPNEEHALAFGGVAYALRDDLNTADSSARFVLVDYLDPDTARPKMALFGVTRATLEYPFEYPLEAGLPILPPMPLAAMPLCPRTYSLTEPPAWCDRKSGWWARSAGDDGGETNADMRFYYQMQKSFFFPALTASNQPAAGTELPWLPTPSSDGGTLGTPIQSTYVITWPDNVPEMKIGQTLTRASQGLPAVWDQLSVESVYQQSLQLSQGAAVNLFDPVVDDSEALDQSVIDDMVAQGSAVRSLTDGLYRFPNLPPSLYPRLFYDSNRGSGGELVLEGQMEETLLGDGYLLLNVLESSEKGQAKDAASGIGATTKSNWDDAVTSLRGAVTNIQPNAPYVHAAAYAGLGNGVGYVTLAFNNSTNPLQVPAGLPVSLNILKVVPELYAGEIEVLEPDDVLSERLSLRYSPDFGGHVGDYEFQWRWEEPEGGLVPNTNYPSWNVYGADPGHGSNEVAIAGASPFTLADHYFAVRYRKKDKNGPTGDHWSPWTTGFAPGWVQRVMNGINPFEQRAQDMIANATDTRATMISLAGPPYEGDIALNDAAVDDAGLIEIYRTVLNRAENFSIHGGINDEGNNAALLFAAGKLSDLYMLLGNEAFADAQDPTIAFPRELSEDEHGAEATGIFCFMNQVPNLLEEELALLRGRDDTLQPSVELTPVYNRLIWNFTKGINGGEPAYAYSYNIRGDPAATVGAITAADAKLLYPQGHGDAWGHYLDALSGYYELLANTNFVWQTKPGATLMGNADVSTDFVDEQSFAEAAAAKARTGVEIVNRTYRQAYSENPTIRWPGYRDADTDRAWGLADWANRTGQGALFDWAVVNSLLVESLTNLTQVGGADRVPEGIQKIDRTTVPELAEIADGLRQVQQQVDNADAGLNPLGIARNVVPFDVDPTEIDSGKTHFEQIYDRALQALYNSCVAFDYARNITLKMREQFDSVYDLQEQLAENETDYHNRLIELYGYPYPDDIGPGGTYPQGYTGPDLVNWQILDLENLVVDAPTGQPVQVVIHNYAFTAGNDFTGTKYKDYTDLPTTYNSQDSVVGTTTVYIADSGLKVKPPSWTGRRPAQGELQMALSEVVQGWYALQAKKADYTRTLAELSDDLDHRVADYNRFPDEWKRVADNADLKKDTSSIVQGMSITRNVVDVVISGLAKLAEDTSREAPKAIVGEIGIAPVELALTDAIGESIKASIDAIEFMQELVANGLESAIIGREQMQERLNIDLEKILAGNEYQDILHWTTLETQTKLKEQYVAQAELLEQVQAIQQTVQQVLKLQAEGQNLLTQRGQVRSRAAQRIQMNRYQDLSFRIFRDDALRRYNDSFDLAARYVYLAAKAYDYETGLLSSDTQLTPGSRFLEDVVRARLPGRFYVWLGEPETGIDEGEPGLADVMARMKADWDVVKGRFGFNNPDTETSRFSLRSERFRVSPLAARDGTWAQVLEDCKVADLRTLPEFKRYCIPFSSSTNAEPALVIPFSTFVVAGKNYFGRDLAGGDNAYDPTHQATKIRSAGIWFTGYNTIADGLANEPRVYLLPVGQDVMRSPTREGLETRNWKILDQALPLPYDVGSADLDNPDYHPITDSLTEPLCQIRRFASLRAYHDSGSFDEAETHNNGRLVGRSVWNTKWLLIIPGRTLLSDPNEGIDRFIYGALKNGVRDGNGVKDIKIFFQTYSVSGE